MKVSRQTRRAEERKQAKEDRKLARQLELSDFTYEATDENMTFSAMGPQLVDFIRVVGLPEFLKEELSIEKRKSLYRPEKLSELLIMQNILGYNRIEGSRVLNQDAILKKKLGISDYPDPETFRDELGRYTPENIGELFVVNRRLIDVLCRLVKAQEVDLHFDSKVITVYGDQEGAETGYNPQKNGRKSYHMKICTIEPFGFILGMRLEPGNAVSNTDFVTFYRQCLDAMPQEHLVVRTVRLDSGFFSEENIESFEGDSLFFEVVAKKYGNILHWVKECIPEDSFEPFYPAGGIEGASFTYHMRTWAKPYEFSAVRKFTDREEDGQGLLFPKWRYQIICHNQPDMMPKEVWEDYNKRAKIELTIRELDYDHFITSVPTGTFNSNYAYFWHCVLAYNVALIFKRFILSEKWHNARTSTVRKNLLNIPGRMVNHSGKMIMRLMAGFPFLDVLQVVKDQLLWLYRTLHPAPA
jgi:hypothetical protein